MQMDKKPDVDPNRPLHETEERSIGVTVPVVLSQRLDRLVSRAEQAGARIIRKDLVAALILAAPEDPEKLHKLFTRYRTAKAADAELSGDQDATILRLQRPKPGRRPRGG
jgi:hypothetical protein